jgi:unsaturated rhamnogalacturonyl hydrolase
MKNNMKKSIIVWMILLTCSGTISSRPKYYIWMAESEMRRNPESWMVDFSTRLTWNYCHGLELGAFLDVWGKTGNRKYFDYVLSYADSIVNNDGSIKTYRPEEYSLDRLNTGKILFPIYQQTKNEKYRLALNLLRKQVEKHPKTLIGVFWHKKIYPHQVWLDGIYMGCPFLAEYAATFDEPELFDLVAHQIIETYRVTKDINTGLLFHGWDESREQRWSDPVTGHSPNFWSRAIGWYMMALVDVLDYFPANHPKRGDIIRILNDLSDALEKYRDPATGMWYQVTDKIGAKGNYLESSGSAMFIYTWIKGSQKGYLPPSFGKKALKAYKQFVKQFVKKNSDGTISITNACEVAGLGGEKEYRDGSYAYYISTPRRDNDPKAVAPFIKMSVLLNK